MQSSTMLIPVSDLWISRFCWGSSQSLPQKYCPYPIFVAEIHMYV